MTEIKKFQADVIYPVVGDPIPNGIIAVDNNGIILEIGKESNFQRNNIKTFKGCLIPGLINTHCHIELSHMKSVIPTGTGLIPFITTVVQHRGASKTKIKNAIANAEKEMRKNGIVAVGDISNTLDSAEIKRKSSLLFHTFVEVFDLLIDSNAESSLNQYAEIYDKMPGKKSIVPHAPYSVSPTLMKILGSFKQADNVTISIHNQETLPELELFARKSGEFLSFYEKFGISLENFNPKEKSSIEHALSYLNPKYKTLFVHNTLTQDSDIKMAHNWSKKVFWATCPNANLYIENRLPNYKIFLENNAKMTIGTDSLTSNWNLSILDEMKTISKMQSYVPLDEILKWATINGAQALGFEDTIGSLEVGKSPGINLLSCEKLNFSNAVKIRKII